MCPWLFVLCMAECVLVFSPYSLHGWHIVQVTDLMWVNCFTAVGKVLHFPLQ